MPVAPTYPGVYIEELPSGVHTIIGVPTSITAFVGSAISGPVNKPITINGFADYERIFGGLDLSSSMSFAVRDFFLNGGSQAIIVRAFYDAVLHDATTQATTVANAVSTGAANSVNGAAGPADVVTAATNAEATAITALPVTVTPAGKSAATAAGAAVVAAATGANKAGIVPPATPQSVADAAAGAVSKAISDAIAGAGVPATSTTITVGLLKLTAADPGSWGENLRASVDFNTSPTIAVQLGLNQAEVFNLTVRELRSDGSVLQTEVFRNVSIEESSRRLDHVLADQSNLVAWKWAATPTSPSKAITDALAALSSAQSKNPVVPADVATAAAAIAKALAAAQQNPIDDDLTAAEKLLASANTQPLTDAANAAIAKASAALATSDGAELTPNSLTGPGTQTGKTGLYALEYADLFNLLCIPPFNLDPQTPGGSIPGDLIDNASVYCSGRRAVLLIDPPADWSTKDIAKAGIAKAAAVGAPTKDAAIFFPRLKEANPLRSGRIESFVPCGAVAGIMARTDTSRGVWKAPAGLDATLFGVSDLAVSLTNAENGELNPLGINCLRNFAAAGQVVWGSRTRNGNDQLADQWKYLPVRRTALYIEETLYRSTQWIVFEPNDEPLWAQIRLNIGAFMQGLFRQGAFQGSSPKDAYFVKCDKETNPQNQIDQGIVQIVVGFAPLKPAEFVIIQIQQMAGQIAV